MTRGGGEERGVGEGGDLAALSEPEFLVLARAGNRAAQARLVHQYTPGIHGLFLRLLGDRDLAQDFTQEVFLRVFSSLERFDAGRSFRAWIFAIAWNLARDHIRTRSRRRVWSFLSAARGPGGGDPEEDGASFDPADSRAVQPHESLERAERAEAVQEALSRLEPQKRAVLILRDCEDLSYEELAELLGCGVGTVKSRVNRARWALRGVLQRLRPGWFEGTASPAREVDAG
jgi:RNA polymerase sigma-70 factor (ECF subfamily)